MPTNINYPLEFPTGVYPNKWSLSLMFDNRRGDNPFSFTNKRVSTNNGDMALALAFPPLQRERGGSDMIAFLAALHGRLGTFYLSLGNLCGDTSGNSLKPNQTDKSYADPDVVGGWLTFDTEPTYNMSGSMLSYQDGRPFIIAGKDTNNRTQYWPPFRMDDANIPLIKSNPVGVWRLANDYPMWSYRNDGLIDVNIAAVGTSLRGNEI